MDHHSKSGMRVLWNKAPSPPLHGVQKTTIMGLPAIRMTPRRRHTRHWWCSAIIGMVLCLYYASRLFSWPSDGPHASAISIPPTIHQLLVDETGRFKTPTEVWASKEREKDKAYGWSVRVWDEEACADLAKQSSAEFARAWALVALQVTKISLCRLLILYEHGGLYLDLDARLVHPLPWKAMLDPVPHPRSWATTMHEDLHAKSRLSSGHGSPGLIVALDGMTSTHKQDPMTPPRFVQWAIAAVPRHAVFAAALADLKEQILGSSRASQEHGKGDGRRTHGRHSQGKSSMSFPANSTTATQTTILDLAFATALSTAVLEHLVRTGQADADALAVANPASARVGDTLVLPGTTFVQAAEHVLEEMRQDLAPEQVEVILAVKPVGTPARGGAVASRRPVEARR